MTNLVLQILGNSDILSSDDEEGYIILEGFTDDSDSKEKILKKVEELPLDEIDFPLIKKLIDSKHNEFDLKNDTIFCFILSDQSPWIKENEPYKEFIDLAKKDGIYWEKLLKSWFKAQYPDLDCFTIPIIIDSTIKNGVADWESMTKLIQKCLNKQICFSEHGIYFSEYEIEFKPPCDNEDSNQDLLNINKIIIQHSSGTPALSGALYLWGIEHKIEGRNVEFVYISDQDEDKDSCEFHSGSHWQWRLKVPQIQELLKIQDFSGAIQLVKSHQQPISSETSENQKLEKILSKLKELDHAVSFNLTDRPFSEPKDAVIERIAIALWSETAFRERGQWMHWYLRVTGAFELAILCLLEKQGNSQFEWKKETINSQSFGNLEKSEELQKSISLFANNHNFSKSPPTTAIVKNLTLEKINNKHSHPIEPIDANNQKWNDFKLFYLENGNFLTFWNEQYNLGFTDIRNKMYHNLMGDIIDNILDKVTQVKPMNNKEHPSQIAIDHLEYIIEIAGLKNEVNEKVNNYKKIFEDLQELLK